MSRDTFLDADLERILRSELKAEGLRTPTYAVLLPIVRGETSLELLMEIRAAGISQAGDPCFPGGRIEHDELPIQAAIRETAEELGLRVDPTQVLGRLPTVQTYLGSKTDIFVCMVAQEDAEILAPKSEEVSEVLRVPLTYFLEHSNHGCFTVNGHVIWGMTAGAIHHLCAVLQTGQTRPT